MPELTGEILAEIQRVLTVELQSDSPVAPERDLATYPEFDSVGLIVLAVGLEDRFRVKLTEADAAGIVTVGDLVHLVQRRVREKSA